MEEVLCLEVERMEEVLTVSSLEEVEVVEGLGGGAETLEDECEDVEVVQTLEVGGTSLEAPCGVVVVQMEAVEVLGVVEDGETVPQQRGEVESFEAVVEDDDDVEMEGADDELEEEVEYEREAGEEESFDHVVVVHKNEEAVG